LCKKGGGAWNRARWLLKWRGNCRGVDLGDVMFGKMNFFGGFEYEIEKLKDEVLSSVKAIEERQGNKKDVILSYLIRDLVKEIEGTFAIASGDLNYRIGIAIDMIVQATEIADKEGKPWVSKLLPITESLVKFEEENITRIKGENL
jgi:hypothetical protein